MQFDTQANIITPIIEGLAVRRKSSKKKVKPGRVKRTTNCELRFCDPTTTRL